ncbi:MAG: helix-turn-helix domain-containing protein [Desulfitobacteriaceae bacterium]
MATDNITFGRFLAQKREERDITLRELARQLEVSAAFLSDVENNRKPPLTVDRLEKAANIMLLSMEEKTKMYDLAGKQRNSIPPDLPEYIIERDYVSAALRTARDLDAGEEEWQHFIDDLKRRKG